MRVSPENPFGWNFLKGLKVGPVVHTAAEVYSFRRLVPNLVLSMYVGLLCHSYSYDYQGCLFYKKELVWLNF